VTGRNAEHGLIVLVAGELVSATFYARHVTINSTLDTGTAHCVSTSSAMSGCQISTTREQIQLGYFRLNDGMRPVL